jgi:hypothetical protein
VLVAAIARRDWSTRLLKAATTAVPGESFSLDGMTYQRLERRARCYEERTVRTHDGPPVIKRRGLEGRLLLGVGRDAASIGLQG